MSMLMKKTLPMLENPELFYSFPADCTFMNSYKVKYNEINDLICPFFGSWIDNLSK
jgi:hypothetical protein